MRGIRFFGLLTLLALCTACSSSPDVPDGSTPLDIFGLARSAQENGQHKLAAEYYEVLHDDYPQAPESANAQWLAAENYYRAGELKDARKLYQDFFKSHPLAQLGVLGERMYDIGIRLYEEGKSGLLGMELFTTSEEGIRALDWITQNLPNGTRADDAFFFIGRARMSQRSYDLAVLNFSEILTRYPQSEWTHEARYLRGVSWLSENRGPDYDRGALIKARADLTTYLRTVERNEALKTEYADRIEGAKERLSEVEERLARKSFLIGRFYYEQERWAAARLYLDLAMTEFPNTAAAADAKAFRGKLPEDG